MKAMKLLAVVLTICMAFSCIAVIPFTAATVASADATPIGVTTDAIYVGPSQRGYSQVSSGAIFPLVYDGSYGQNSVIKLTFDVKMLAGTKPYVEIFNYTKNRNAGSGSSAYVTNGATYIGMCNNGSSSITDGVYTTTINIGSNLDTSNLWYYDTENGEKQVRISTAAAAATSAPAANQVPVWGVIRIGNVNYGDEGEQYYGDGNSAAGFNSEFLIKNVKMQLTTVANGNGTKSNGDYISVPAVSSFDSGSVYGVTGTIAEGGLNNSKNHPANAKKNMWSICSPDEDTVRLVTVPNDAFSSTSHSYTYHPETEYEYGYYTCSDFGDVKFDKVGNCYFKSETKKQSVIIKDHDGDATSIANKDTDAEIVYSNLFIPINSHKWYSAYGQNGCASNRLKETSATVRLRITFTAKRLSGSGQPIVGRMYPNASGGSYDATYASGDDIKTGAPCSNPERAYNNNTGVTEASKNQNYLASTYNASTGAFTADMAIVTGNYNYSSRKGVNSYITIGLAEHGYGAKKYDSYSADGSFIISDIKMYVYAINDSNTMMFSGANVAPKMLKSNFDTTTTYVYFGENATNEYINSTKTTKNCGMRHANIGMYSTEGCVQNVTTVDKKICYINNCSLTHHASTDTTCEYWACTTHGKYYDDKYASNEIDDISANKKMIVVKQSGALISGTVIPLDVDGWNGSAKTFIFKCKMKVFGDNIPRVTRFYGSYYGGTGGMPSDGATNNINRKDGSKTLWIDYDPDTCTYTAAFTMWRNNYASGTANAKDYFRYTETNTGANNALMIGNSKPYAQSGTIDKADAMGFAMADPQIYEAVDAAAGTYTGPNLCAQINDKTLNFDGNYPYSNTTLMGTEYAARGNNSPMAAPLNKWSKYGNAASYISATDIPAGFFSNDNTSRMLCFSGQTTSTNAINGTTDAYEAVSKEIFISPSTTYKFEYDYRAYGGQIHTRVQAANGSGYSAITPLEEWEEGEPHYSNDHADGAHYSIIFTTPADLRTSGGGNFRIYIGQQNGYQTKKTTSIYLSNFSLYAIDTDGDQITESYNAFMNGGFYFGAKNTDITESNFGTTMLGWDSNNASSTGKPALLGFKFKQLLDIPDNFFDEDFYGYMADGTGDDDLAYKFVGGDYANYRFDFNLPSENATYELSWNYRCEDDDIEGVIVQGTGNVSLTPVVTTVENGNFVRKYTISTTTSTAQTTNRDGNVRILINVGSYSQGKAYYLGNLSLRKKNGNYLEGPNLIADANPIFDRATYYPVTNNSFSMPIDNNTTTQVVVGHRWSAANEDSKGRTCYVSKVSNTFFNYYTAAQRITYMTNVLLNKGAGYNPYTDNQNPYYNPINGSSMTILDLVKIKKDACTADDEGGAGVEANNLLTAINKETNKFTESGSTVTITSSNSSSASSAVSGKKTIYISKTATGTGLINAMNSAQTGAIILLERGGAWRMPKTSSTTISMKNDQKIGTYGTGAKPIIMGSGDNYGGSSHTSYWTEESTNIWKVKVHGGTSSISDYMMPGLVYFFARDNYTDAPVLVGNHDKNAETAGTGAMNFNAKNELTEEGDVYYPAAVADFKDSSGNNGYLYVYCNQNPASKYPKIEIGLKRSIIEAASGCSIDGLSLMYGGGIGISASGKTNLSITNCEIAYIGGSPNSSGTNKEYCFGNGVQFGQGGTDLTVDHCYVHHCFDAGLTFQSFGTSNTTFDGVNFTNNLLTNNAYNIEFFTTGDLDHKSSGAAGNPNGTMRNINITGNIMRFAGECASLKQRADYLRIANICVTADAWYVNTSNLLIRDNIFDCTMVSQIMWTWGGISTSIKGENATNHVGTTITNNSYFQKAGSREGRVGHYGNVTSSYYDFAGSTTRLDAAVQNIEASPARVKWVNRADKY